ncbi:MAG: hypothetical protein AAGC65_13315 [Mucilaginibacter sp.]|uniref:hypothetical protein n=1 Tax=Mucilaginibacter sp. TaxID=1882438 RepID=UPI0031AB5F7A
MKDFALLIGNDINNINPGKSWKQLLEDITSYCGVNHINREEKPFPLLYEEIFLSAIRTKRIEEKDLKTYIAKIVSEINENEIHERIRSMGVPHIMTTNYEFSIEGRPPKTNSSLVTEKLYSIFRKHEMDGTTYWHLHGDCNNPISINLGYEHYCGQLQNMRNYTLTGTDYKTEGILKESLVRRLTHKKPVNYQSWIDLFFTKDIYILGLGLDFVESDLWWLLTYRARSKYYKTKFPINNKITYFIPAEYEARSKSKLEILRANDVDVIPLKSKNKLSYYKSVLNMIDKNGK